MYAAAGILPFTKVNNKTMFLVGKDVRDNSYSDFGGKVELVDEDDPVTTAAREFYEETLGCVFANPVNVKRRLVWGDSARLEGNTRNGNMYYMYLLEMPYNDKLSLYFSRMYDFLKYKKFGKKTLEKTEIKWVDLDTLMTIPKRDVFYRTILKNYEVISAL